LPLKLSWKGGKRAAQITAPVKTSDNISSNQ
jgi:hypothetical protein